MLLKFLYPIFFNSIRYHDIEYICNYYIDRGFLSFDNTAIYISLPVNNETNARFSLTLVLSTLETIHDIPFDEIKGILIFGDSVSHYIGKKKQNLFNKIKNKIFTSNAPQFCTKYPKLNTVNFCIITNKKSSLQTKEFSKKECLKYSFYNRCFIEKDGENLSYNEKITFLETNVYICSESTLLKNLIENQDLFSQIRNQGIFLYKNTQSIMFETLNKNDFILRKSKAGFVLKIKNYEDGIEPNLTDGLLDIENL